MKGALGGDVKQGRHIAQEKLVETFVSIAFSYGTIE